ncbi:DUF1302 domain-containing protein [Pseudomonas sp. CFBP13509]|uniref:DUF1302 domain-containing protein n=1 Tax=unclassified Pseudomonas TaxID=196821 RepID=UPI0010C0B9EA|nr:DUF1302 domain-containing protein [Pseudomonas sp. CFBP13509]TKJ80315.1 DUF1302 domain-containing protein [Pseudomonas sp. CFBP13509]
MKKTIPIPKVGRHLLLLGFMNLVGTSVSAAQFSVGEIEGNFDSILTLGGSWSLQNPDANLLRNRGTDDGRRNFKKGENFSTIFKGIHDLELKYEGGGVFVRGKYWYDFKLTDDSLRYKDINNSHRDTGSRSSGAEVLDAFIYHNYQIGELPGSVRLGKQVLSWGEGTFITGGLNVINPVNVAAIRRPGSEIKEGLIPVNLLYVSQNLTDEVSLDTFYQLQWEKTVIDNCATFFSQVDGLAHGCNGQPVGPDLTTNAAARAALIPLGIDLSSEGIIVPRSDDKEPKNSGQWGTALRWLVPEINSEFAGYFINYHSRQSYLGVTSGPHATDSGFAGALCGNLGIPAGGCNNFLSSAAGGSLVQAYRLGSSKYFVEYPENIQLYGISFNTSLPSGTSLAGELSYRPNMPLQVNAVDLILAPTGVATASPLISSGDVAIANNQDLKGYRRKEVTQAQLTATHFFDQFMGAERLSLIGEVGVTHIGGLGGKGGLRYGRSSAFGQGELFPNNSVCIAQTNSTTPYNCTSDGFATSTSWGYRARAIWEYTNVIPGVELRPSVAWSHDVSGYGPEPGFNEGSKAISIALDTSYLNTYSANISYTNYFGGDYNINIDRDFLAVNVGVSF